MARMAMTIISQSLCLRSNFIITKTIVAAPKLTRKSVAAALWVARAEPHVVVLELHAAKRLQFTRRLPDQFPRLAQMFFGGEHVAEANSHHRSAVQFCLGKISASGSIDLLHEFAVDSIDGAGAPSRRWARARRGRRSSNETK